MNPKSSYKTIKHVHKVQWHLKHKSLRIVDKPSNLTSLIVEVSFSYLKIKFIFSQLIKCFTYFFRKIVMNSKEMKIL